MKYAPAADDLIGLFNGAGVKYFVFELMDSVGVDRFDFESSLLTATGISLRDDLLEMMSGEVLASLVSGRDGKGEASLNFLIERTERANEEFNSVLSKLEMYYGEDAKDDFSLIDDGGELKWNAIRYGKDLETEKYKDVLIMKRRIGTFAGQEVGLYIAETEDLFVISSSLAGAKMNLDYVLMKGREVPVGVVNLLGEVSEKEMLKVYLEGVEFAKIFPDSVVPSGFEKFVMQVASVKNGLLGKIDIDGLKGVKAKVEPEVVEVEEEKKVDPAFSAFINDLVNCKVGSKYEGWIRNEMMMMAGAKEILQSYEIVGGEKSACEYVGELKDVNIDKEFVISFALSFGADEAEIREQFAGIDESDMRDELMADASKVKCVGVSHMLVEQLVDQLDGSFKFPDDRSVCEEL
jgi:hypothetical protein